MTIEVNGSEELIQIAKQNGWTIDYAEDGSFKVIDDEGGVEYTYHRDGTLETTSINATSGEFGSLSTGELLRAPVADPADGASGIQSASDDAGQDGAVILESGSFTFGSSVTPQSGQTIKGQGRDATVLTVDSAATLTMFTATGVNNVTIRDLTIDLNLSDGRALKFVDTYGCSLENVTVRNAAKPCVTFEGGPVGGDANYGEGDRIHNCRFDNISNVNIWFKDPAEYNVVSDCEFYGNGKGIAARLDGANNRFVNNKVTHANEGIRVDSSASNEGKHLIENNQFNHILSAPAVNLVGTQAVSVLGNKFLVTNQQSVYLSGANECEVKHNMTKCNGTGYDAIHLDGSNCTANHVLGNMDRSTSDAQYPINETNSASGNVIRDNTTRTLSFPTFNSAAVGTNEQI